MRQKLSYGMWGKSQELAKVSAYGESEKQEAV